ncbi:streptophobe family protein [Kitasatospora griseola]|uniref:streptophobe family protein n=1 Tax=Kitasatospora griseola TaxID=2064 RepID=UPI00382D9B6E
MPPTPPHLVPARTLWRHALEGALSVVAALAVMAGTAWLALSALGAGAVAPVSRLVPALVGMAVGGGVTVESAPSAPSDGADDDGLGGMLGGLDLRLTGELSLVPLALTFAGTAVLGIGYFRPLRRRPRPASSMLWSRGCGALAAALLAFPLLAGAAHGTARLPESVTRRFGGGGGGRGGMMGRFGGGGGLGSGLSSAAFELDVAGTALLGVLWTLVVLAVGCVAARRTTLSRPLALGRLRQRWNAVLSALTGIAAVLCCVPLVLALLAGAAALTGREQAARAAGLLLLAGPNLVAALLSTGSGASWDAGIHRVRPSGGGMFGGFGDGGDGATGGDRSVDLGAWSGAGAPLWLIGLLCALVLLVVAGYLAARRTPARTRREEEAAMLGQHAATAVRLAAVCAVVLFAMPLLASAAVRIGVSAMGREMGGVNADLDARAGLSVLAGAVLAALAGYAGSRLHGWRATRRTPTAVVPHPALARAAARRPSDRVS